MQHPNYKIAEKKSYNAWGIYCAILQPLTTIFDKKFPHLILSLFHFFS